MKKDKHDSNVPETEGSETASNAFSIILHKVGDHGRFQVKLMVIAGFCGIFTSMHNMGAVFLAGTPDHWCQVPYFSERNLTTGKELRNLTAPWITSKDGSLQPSRCTYIDRDYAELIPSNQSPGRPDPNYSNETNQTVCSSWTYDNQTFQSTVVTEWNLVCDKRWQMSSTQASYMMGILTGAVVFSAISDRIGRRRPSLICACLFITCSISAAFSTSFLMFLLLRFIVAASGQGMFLINYILTMECVSRKGRNIFGNIFHVFFIVGFVFLPLFAYLVPDWRNLQLTCSIPTVILLSYFWLLPESPRWLLMNGREKDGVESLKKIAATNKEKFLEKDDLDPLLKTIANEVQRVKLPTNCRDKMTSIFGNAMMLVRTPNLRRRSLIVFYAWFVVSMTYYGLTFSGSNLNASLYVVVFLSAVIEFPALVGGVIILMRFGRRPILSGSLLLAGFFCISIAFVPTHLVWVNVTMATMGKFMISISFMLVFMYSAELVPTNARNMSIGMASMCARIGSGLAPYIVDLLGDVYYAIPSTIFGVLAAISGLLSLLLPETANRILPESVQEIEMMPR